MVIFNINKKIDHKIDIIEELILENNEYVQDSYKITTWYCDLYHRLCCCFKKTLKIKLIFNIFFLTI